MMVVSQGYRLPSFQGTEPERAPGSRLSDPLPRKSSRSFIIVAIAVMGMSAPASEGQESGRSSLPLFAIRGHLYLEGTREPLQGFQIYLYQRWTELGQAKTDVNGHFEFGLIRTAPSKVRLLIRPPLAFYEVPAETVELGPQSGDVDVTLYARCVFPATWVRDLMWEGRVLQWDGVSPVEGAVVALRRETYDLQETRTDGRGFFKFVFRDLPPGMYRLRVTTGNDLLQDTTRELRIGEEDVYRNEPIVLESAQARPLQRMTILGRVAAPRGGGWAAVGAEVRFSSGPHMLGKTTVGDEGYFHREKLYAPIGPIVVQVVPRLGLLKTGQSLLYLPEANSSVPTVRAQVDLRPSVAWWIMMVALPLGGCLCLWALLRSWVLPEWRALRSSMVRPPSRGIRSGIPRPDERREGRKERKH